MSIPSSTQAASTQAESAADEAYGSVGTYATGFVLAAILTGLSFAVALSGGFGATMAAQFAIAALAGARILVHMVYFLRLGDWPESGWTLLSLIFTVIVVVLVLMGSLWVMYNLNINTMPMPGSAGARGL